MKLKYLLGILIGFVVMIAFFSIQSESNAATTYTENGVTATLADDGTLTISGKGEVPHFIVQRFFWDNVIDKGNGFWNLSGFNESKALKIKKAIIKNGITSISFRIFDRCSALNSITIPSSIIEIDVDTLGECSGLTAINVDSNNSIYSSVNGILLNKDKTELIRYPAGKKTTSYTIPSNITEIRDEAFAYCKTLEDITISKEVINIDTDAFRGCSGLEKINVDSNNTIYSSINGVLFSKDKSKLIRYPLGKSSNTYTIPNSVTIIGNSAFCDSDNLTNIYISNNVTNIESSSFSGCSSLSKIEIPNNVTNIGSQAFSWCTGLKSITIPSSVTSMEGSIFNACSNDLIIICKTNSTAYKYAKTNDIKYTVDDTAPTLTVTGNPTSWTKNNATLTIKASDSSSGLSRVTVNGKAITMSSGTATYTVTANGTYTVIATDKVGNTKTVTQTVSKIDKTVPTLTVTPNTTDVTNKNVTLTIKASDSASGLKTVTVNGKAVTMSNGTGTYAVTANGTYTVIATDNVGNTKTVTQKVTNIDKIAPQVIITGKAHGVTAGLIRHLDGNYNVLSGHLNSTTAWKDIAGIQNGTVNGGAQFYNNGFILLDGEDDWVNLGQITDLEKVTLEAEVVFPKFEEGNKIIMCNYNSGGTGLQINNGQLMFVAHINGAFRYLKVPELLQENKNYHIAGTYDGTKMRIYVNGALQAEQEITGTIKNPLGNTVMAIGANPVGSNIVEGYNANMRLYAARVYNTALTESQIRQNMVSDRVKPAVIASNSEQIRLTIIFSEAVTGFDESDIVVQRVDSSGTEITGAKANIKSGSFSGSGRLYGFTLENIPGSAYYKVSIKDKSYTDAAGNQGKTASVMGYRDIAGPPVTITANTGDTTSASAVTYTINVKEYHTGLTKNDIEVTNGTKGAFTKVSDLEYKLVVTNSGNCEQTITIPAGACHDKAGNASQAASKTITIDREGLTCAVTANLDKKATNADTVSYTIEFNKPVVYFAKEKITVTNGTIQSLTEETAKQKYTVVVEGGVTGVEQTVQVKANECEDEAENKNKASNIERVKIDKTSPTIEVTQNPQNWTNENVVLTIKATDEYTEISGIAVGVTPIGEIDENGVATYEVRANGTYTIKATDEAGNSVTKQIQVNNIDVTKPELSVSLSTTEETIDNVVLTVNAQDKQSGLNKVIIKKIDTETEESEDEIEMEEIGEGIYEITENGRYEITAIDNAGNEKSQTISVENIQDKEEIEDIIEIDTYLLNNKLVKNVQPDTTLEELKENITIHDEEKVKILSKNNKELSAEDLITTGSKIQVYIDGQTVEYIIVVAGDTTGDGKADMLDMISINKHRIKKKTLENEYFVAGDVNKDGKLDMMDMIIVNKYRIGNRKTL